MTEVWALAGLWFGAGNSCDTPRHLVSRLRRTDGDSRRNTRTAYFGRSLRGARARNRCTLDHRARAIVLTFLAGAELDPMVFRQNWKEAVAVGLIGFFAPFFGCAVVAHWILGWAAMQSWLAGVALSTTSVAVVYAVMLEYGLNKTGYGKIVLAACFINDLGTVLALGFIFAPFQ